MYLYGWMLCDGGFVQMWMLELEGDLVCINRMQSNRSNSMSISWRSLPNAINKVCQ